MADVAAGQRLAEHQNVRQDQVGHKAVARPAKAGGDLVENQQHAVLVAQLTGTLQKRNVVHFHAAGALQQRLDDEAVQLVVIEGKGLFERGDLGRDMDDALFFVEGEVIVLVVADLHRLEGVAVVGVLQCEDQRALFHLRMIVALVGVVLQRHLEGDFDGHAAGIRKEAVVQIARQKFFQLSRQLFDRIVGESAQHDMAEIGGLLLNGGRQLGVLIAVDHAPPGGDGVNQLLILGVKMDALCLDDLIGRFHGFHLLIRIPDHVSDTSSYSAAKSFGSIGSSCAPSGMQASTGRPVCCRHMAMLSSSIVSPR